MQDDCGCDEVTTTELNTVQNVEFDVIKDNKTTTINSMYSIFIPAVIILFIFLFVIINTRKDKKGVD